MLKYVLSFSVEFHVPEYCEESDVMMIYDELESYGVDVRSVRSFIRDNMKDEGTIQYLVDNLVVYRCVADASAILKMYRGLRKKHKHDSAEYVIKF